jgi:hypothetical protein
MLDRRACRKTSVYTIRDTRLLASNILDELATASWIRRCPAPLRENVERVFQELVEMLKTRLLAGRLHHKAIGDSRLRTALP